MHIYNPSTPNSATQLFLLYNKTSRVELLLNVDDFEVDPTSGLLYATVNVNGADGKLIVLDPATAAVTEVGLFRDTATGATVDNMEGLSFDATGQLYTSGGNHSQYPQDNNKLCRIDKQTGMTTLVGAFTPGQVDYYALGCLTV